MNKSLPLASPLWGRVRSLLLIGASLSLAAGSLWSQPTDNPVAAHYGPGGYPSWVDAIAWNNVIDMSTYANGADNFEKFENARDELYGQGGGVLYYPAGTYVFDLPDMGYGSGIGPLSRGLMLKSGVVIRGEDPSATASSAVVRASDDPAANGFYNNVGYNLDPATVFVFPTQMRGTDPSTLAANSAGELPSDWSLIGMVPGEGEAGLAAIDRIGVVNVKLDGGIIFWGYETPRAATRTAGKWLSEFKTNWPSGAPLEATWGGTAPDGTHYMDAINGSTGWHTEVSAGSGRLVFGVVIANGAPVNDMIHVDRKHTASTASAADSFAHYRFTGRITVHGSDVFVANNVIAKPTKNFVHRMLQRRWPSGPNEQRNVLFDYANHIGIDINKSNFGGNQDHPSVTADGSGYYLPNVIVRDNWVFSRGNKGFEVSGKWMTMLNNHNERYYTGNIFPAGYIANPEVYLTAPIDPNAPIDAGGISFDGWFWQTSESDRDFMSRGYDLGGNNIWVSHNSVINTGSAGNDGEGVMGQRHNNVETFSWAFTYNVQDRVNRGPGTFGEPGWIGIYDMHAAGLLLLHNATPGTHGILKAASNWILDATVTPNAGSGGTGTPATLHTAGADYQAIHTDAVNAPLNVEAQYVHDGMAVRISYDDASDNELGFRIDRRINGGSWQPIAYRAAQNLGKSAGVTYAQNGMTYPVLNPEEWVDFTVSQGMNVDYRVVAINSNDDGSTGISETVSLGTPPAIPVPADVFMAIAGQDVEFEFHAASGYRYQLQRNATLDPESWVNVGPEFPGSGTEEMLSDPGAAPSSAGAPVFYRIKVTE